MQIIHGAVQAKVKREVQVPRGVEPAWPPQWEAAGVAIQKSWILNQILEIHILVAGVVHVLWSSCLLAIYLSQHSRAGVNSVSIYLCESEWQNFHVEVVQVFEYKILSSNCIIYCKKLTSLGMEVTAF